MQALAVAGPYSQAVSHPNTASTIYISGQMPALPSGEILLNAPQPEQAKACIANMLAILQAASPGATLRNIVKCNVFIVNMADFANFNRGYEEAFGDHRPARSCVAVKELPKGIPIEIEAIAVI